MGEGGNGSAVAAPSPSPPLPPPPPHPPSPPPPPPFRIGLSWAGAWGRAARPAALAVRAVFPDTQVDLGRIGALRMLLDRAGTPGADNADIRSRALTTLQHLASNGANMAAQATKQTSVVMLGVVLDL